MYPQKSCGNVEGRETRSIKDLREQKKLCEDKDSEDVAETGEGSG